MNKPPANDRGAASQWIGIRAECVYCSRFTKLANPSGSPNQQEPRSRNGWSKPGLSNRTPLPGGEPMFLWKKKQLIAKSGTFLPDYSRLKAAGGRTVTFLCSRKTMGMGW